MSDMTPPPAPAPVGGEFTPQSDTSKLLAALGYLIGIVALVAILIEPYKNEKFVRLHALQALALWVTLIVANVVAVVPIIGWIVWVAVWIGAVVLGIMGLINAFQGKYWEMPLIGGFVKQYI